MQEISCWQVMDVAVTIVAGMMETLSYIGKPGDQILTLEGHLCHSVLIFIEKLHWRQVKHKEMTTVSQTWLVKQNNHTPH